MWFFFQIKIVIETPLQFDIREQVEQILIHDSSVRDCLLMNFNPIMLIINAIVYTHNIHNKLKSQNICLKTQNQMFFEILKFFWVEETKKYFKNIISPMYVNTFILQSISIFLPTVNMSKLSLRDFKIFALLFHVKSADQG